MSEAVKLRSHAREMIGKLDRQLLFTIAALYELDKSKDDDAIKGIHQLKDEMKEAQNTIQTIQELNGWI